MAYQNLFGMTRKDYEAKRREAERLLDVFAFGIYTGNLDTKDPQNRQLAQAYRDDPPLRGIVDNYIAENKDDWDAMPDWRRGVAPPAVAPGTADTPDWQRSLALADEDQARDTNMAAEDFGSDLAFGDNKVLDKGFGEFTLGTQFRAQDTGLPWKSLKAQWRDSPNADQAKFKEGNRQRWEAMTVELLPIEGQRSYFGARKEGRLDEWRQARREEGDEWGAILNNQALKPVSLRTMLDAEYGDALGKDRDPQQYEVRLAKLIRNDYLMHNGVKPEVMDSYWDDPLAYAEDYQVVNVTKVPNLISGRDELTPTARELAPPVSLGDQRILAEKIQTFSELKMAYSKPLLEGLKNDDHRIVEEIIALDLKPDCKHDVIYTPEGPLSIGKLNRFLQTHTRTLARAKKIRDQLLELRQEGKSLAEVIIIIRRQHDPALHSHNFDVPAERYDNPDGIRQIRSKRIQVRKLNPKTGVWEKFAIDPMQLVLQEMTYKNNFSTRVSNFIDKVACALHSGLAGLISNDTLGLRFPRAYPQVKVIAPDKGKEIIEPSVITFDPDSRDKNGHRLPIYLDPEIIVYTLRYSGTLLRWKNFNNAPGLDRIKHVFNLKFNINPQLNGIKEKTINNFYWLYDEEKKYAKLIKEQRKLFEEGSEEWCEDYHEDLAKQHRKIKKILLHINRSKKNNYSSNWSYTSRYLRAERGWICQRCGIHLAGKNGYLLQVHHKNGNKIDNREDNLEVLCVLCHSERDGHEHLLERLDVDDLLYILRKRREGYSGQ